MPLPEQVGPPAPGGPAGLDVLRGDLLPGGDLGGGPQLHPVAVQELERASVADAAVVDAGEGEVEAGAAAALQGQVHVVHVQDAEDSGDMRNVSISLLLLLCARILSYL